MGWLKKATGGKIQTPTTLKGAAKSYTDVMFAGTGLGDKLFGEKKKPGDDGYAAQQQALLDQKQAAYDDFIQGGAPVYQNGEALKYQDLGQLEQLGDSAYNDISTDPKYKNAELDALRSLEERSKEGLTKQDEADMLKLRQDTDRRSRGRQGAIQQNMQQRGISGSGLDLVAQMQSSQDATEEEALASIEKAAQSQNNKRAATNDLGNMSSQMQAKDYQQQAQKAAAADTIARYNNANTNQVAIQNNQGQNAANTQNWNRTNTTTDKNTSSAYDFRKDKLGAQNAQVQSAFDWNANQQNAKMLKDQQDKAAKAGQWGTIGAVGGGIVGGIYGGPAGAAAGSQVGGQLGQSYGSFAFGGKVPGPEIVPYFDDPANDIFSAQLSPGEIVLPKSVAKDPQAAASFVANENAKEIDPAILDHMSKSDPELVAKYRAKMSGADQGVKDAQKAQDWGNYGNIAGSILNDFNNSQKRDLVYENRMQDLGKAPQVVKADRPAWDDSKINNLTGQGIQRAEQGKKNADSEFWNEEKLTDMGVNRSDQNKAREKAARMEDPNSAESKSKRDFIAATYPTIAQSAGFENASAAFLDQNLPFAVKAYESAEARRSHSADLAASRENTRALRDISNQTRAGEKQEKNAEKMEQLRIGDLGYAQTPDDAKQLKTAIESKSDFDGKLDELISLREKHGGGAIMNREDVGRANQLSKDLLLEYKNMAKLGVLSVSDEKILNKIIPADPLEYNSPLAALQGQDPILENMKKFKSDAEKDYQTKLGNRLRREGRQEPAKKVEKQPAPHGNKVEQDGVTYVWNGSEYVEE